MIYFLTVSLGIVIGWIIRSMMIKGTPQRWVSAKTKCPLCGHIAIHVYPEGIDIECAQCGNFHEPIILKTYDDHI